MVGLHTIHLSYEWHDLFSTLDTGRGQIAITRNSISTHERTNEYTSHKLALKFRTHVRHDKRFCITLFRSPSPERTEKIKENKKWKQKLHWEIRLQRKFDISSWEPRDVEFITGHKNLRGNFSNGLAVENRRGMLDKSNNRWGIGSSNSVRETVISNS